MLQQLNPRMAIWEIMSYIKVYISSNSRRLSIYETVHLFNFIIIMYSHLAKINTKMGLHLNSFFIIHLFLFGYLIRFLLISIIWLIYFTLGLLKDPLKSNVINANKKYVRVKLSYGLNMESWACELGSNQDYYSNLYLQIVVTY